MCIDGNITKIKKKQKYKRPPYTNTITLQSGNSKQHNNKKKVQKREKSD